MDTSINLTPEGPIAKELEQLIRDLGKRYDAPVFSPHVTLLGNIDDPDAAAKAKALAHKLTPFTLTLAEAGYQDTFFRCLFLRIESPELVRANTLAQQLFAIIG